MKNVQNMVNEGIKILGDMGIQTGLIINTFHKEWTGKWGICKSRQGMYFEIGINSLLLKDDVPDEVTMDTVLHELLHTVEGCLNHGTEWKRLASMVNRKHGLNIKRTTAQTEKGIQLKTNDNVKYIIQCQKCQQEIKRTRMSKAVEHPEWFKCGCGGALKRIK